MSQTTKRPYPSPGDNIIPAGRATGIYVRREAGAVTLNAFAGGTQYRYTLDASQAAALADQLTTETDGVLLVHVDADVFMSSCDATHNQD